MGDPPVGRGTPGEALALAPDCHDQLLQADAVHALCQVTVPITQNQSFVMMLEINLKECTSLLTKQGSVQHSNLRLSSLLCS